MSSLPEPESEQPKSPTKEDSDTATAAIQQPDDLMISRSPGHAFENHSMSPEEIIHGSLEPVLQSIEQPLSPESRAAFRDLRFVPTAPLMELVNWYENKKRELKLWQEYAALHYKTAHLLDVAVYVVASFTGNIGEFQRTLERIEKMCDKLAEPAKFVRYDGKVERTTEGTTQTSEELDQLSRDMDQIENLLEYRIQTSKAFAKICEAVMRNLECIEQTYGEVAKITTNMEEMETNLEHLTQMIGQMAQIARRGKEEEAVIEHVRQGFKDLFTRMREIFQALPSGET